MPYDVMAIKESVDLLALIGQDTVLRQVGSNEYAGPCPRCGGQDRFHVNTEKGWFCRQCYFEADGRLWHDVIEYIRWRDGCDFQTACKRLGGLQRVPEPSIRRKVRKNSRRDSVVESKSPNDAWQKRARSFISYAQEQLWRNSEGLSYLRGRGLSDDTIRHAGLGYNPREIRDKPERWGISGRVVWLPRGWVIPCELDEIIHYVKIRQVQGNPKYIAIRGSRKRGVVYGLGSIQGQNDLIICEGEFNALILSQILYDVAAVVSVGDAGNQLGLGALGKMNRIGRWWFLFDLDKAGEKGATRLAEAYDRARQLSWPFEGDINDAYLAGHDLAALAIGQIGPRDRERRRNWLKYHLDRLYRPSFSSGTNVKDPAQHMWLALYAEFKEANLAVGIQSRLLGEDFWFASNERGGEILERGVNDEDMVVYTIDEMSHLKALQLNNDDLRKIHLVKKIFDGEIVGLSTKRRFYHGQK